MTGQVPSRTPAVANLWAGVICAALGALALLWLIPEFVTGANHASQSLTPGFMPRVGAWCLVLFGVSVAIGASLTIWGHHPPVAEESEENETLSFGRHEIINAALIAILSTLYVYALSLLGFFVPSALMLACLIYLTGYRNKLVLLLIAVAFPLILELLLWHLLKVPLPQFPLVSF